MKVPRNLIVVGDRVLIVPDEDTRTTHSGLYLPQGVHESDGVRAGRVIATGPGVPLPSLHEPEDEPWKEAPRQDRYLPMQVKVGDYALFFKKAAVEVRYDGLNYLVVPQSAILIITRDEQPPVPIRHPEP